MVLGPAGCGKTTVWKTLMACHNRGSTKPSTVAETVNPKAVLGGNVVPRIRATARGVAVSHVMARPDPMKVRTHPFTIANWHFAYQLVFR